MSANNGQTNDIRILEGETIVRDTNVNGCHISYVIRDNDELAGYENEYRFRCREVDLTILQNGIKNHYLIKRDLFTKWVNRDDLNLFSIQSFDYTGLDDTDNLHFELMLCIPDTDEAYLFDLTPKDEAISIIENPIQWEEYDFL